MDNALYVRKVLVETVSCVFCEHWVHTNCRDMKSRLRSVPDYECKKCAVRLDHLREY